MDGMSCADPSRDPPDKRDASLALSELPIAHEWIESFLDEIEAPCSEEPIRQRDRSAREFREGQIVSWEKVKLDNGL